MSIHDVSGDFNFFDFQDLKNTFFYLIEVWIEKKKQSGSHE